MKSGFGLSDKPEISISRGAKLRSGLKLKGRFQLECRDKNGKLKWTEDIHNIITNEGLDHILNVILHGTSAIATWYCVMSETNTAPAAGLTYAVPSFTELQAYDEATRPAYVEAAASGQSITNSANKAVFTINDTKTLYGAALVGGGTDGNTKGDTAGGGTLLCYALFSSSRAVVNDDVVNLTYTLGAADDGV